jgi:hypothetical protein
MGAYRLGSLTCGAPCRFWSCRFYPALPDHTLWDRVGEVAPNVFMGCVDMKRAMGVTTARNFQVRRPHIIWGARLGCSKGELTPHT